MSYFFYNNIIFCGYMICKKGKYLKQRIEAQSKIQNKLFSPAIISEIQCISMMSRKGQAIATRHVLFLLAFSLF